jgi:hypothetical protein
VVVTFYAEDQRNRANSVYLKLPAAQADYLLFALAYRLPDLVNPRGLLPTDLLLRINSVRRQFALGRAREFTSRDVPELELLVNLEELEKIAERARTDGTNVLLFND